MHFLKHNLMPTSHTAIVNLPKLHLLHSILNARSINLGQLIVDEAFAGITRKQCRLLFPRLITSLCRQKGVMEDETDFFIRGRQGIKPSQIPSLMGFDEDATTRAPPGGAHEVPLFPIFPRNLFQHARPTIQKNSQEHQTPHALQTKKHAASTSIATPQTHPPVPDERATAQVPPAPAQGLKTPTSAPKFSSKAPSSARRTLTRKGKALVKPNPPTPAPETTVEFDSADDDEDIPDALIRFPARNDQTKAGERIHQKQQILEKGSCADAALDQRPRIRLSKRLTTF
ncbi:hypothetical protein V6N11_025619 [Hibiscus sabdariffa]|uniref:Putative plant transposon protein domain-containing protein n=1 Tax=Hibiscus sabdariffa TaxID=183260 RepID=A0ABR2SU30_9ROSI